MVEFKYTLLIRIKPKVIGDSPPERFYHAADAYNDELWILGGNAGMRFRYQTY